MAMTGGTASIVCHADGSATFGGSGLAEVMAQARFASQVTSWTATASLYPGGVLPANLLTTYQAAGTQIAADCQAEAVAMVAYLQGNAQAVLTTGATTAEISPSLAGLQKAGGVLTTAIGGDIPAEIPVLGVNIPIQ